MMIGAEELKDYEACKLCHVHTTLLVEESRSLNHPIHHRHKWADMWGEHTYIKRNGPLM